MTGYTKNGIYLINESRAYLDMEGVEYGDRPLVNGTMIPLDVAANKTGTATVGQQPAAAPPQDDEGEETEDDQEGGEEDEESED